MTSKIYTYLGTCWKCNEDGHLAKECKNIISNTSRSGHIIQEQTITNTPKYACSTLPISQIKQPTATSLTNHQS